ncbi:MAG TPA: DNA-binding protein WhiA [Gaiellaceae bacterium]|nr:DNA-binding protein WhiA [Gaiellaceae bacterium]
MTDPTATLAEDVRAELAAIAPRRECDRLAELSALFHSAGRLHLRGRGEVAVHLDLASSAAARRAFSLLRALGLESEIRTYRRRAFERETRYELHVQGTGAALATLVRAGVVDRARRPLARPPRRVIGRSCCRCAYLRGAYLGAGTLVGPPSPHLELRAETRDGAEFLRAVAAAEGVTLAVAERRSHALAYAKSWEAIEAVLGLAGATDAVLALEERSVVAAARSQANRLANADHANLVRTSRAAERQLAALARLRAEGLLERLDGRLREAALLRLRHPALSLRELAARADPPASKAGMQRRLARLVELARE